MNIMDIGLGASVPRGGYEADHQFGEAADGRGKGEVEEAQGGAAAGRGHEEQGKGQPQCWQGHQHRCRGLVHRRGSRDGSKKVQEGHSAMAALCLGRLGITHFPSTSSHSALASLFFNYGVLVMPAIYGRDR